MTKKNQKTLEYIPDKEDVEEFERIFGKLTPVEGFSEKTHPTGVRDIFVLKWEVEFEKKFCHHDAGLELNYNVYPSEIRDFIQQTLDQALEKQRKEIHGILRQYCVSRTIGDEEGHRQVCACSEVFDKINSLKGDKE